MNVYERQRREARDARLGLSGNGGKEIIDLSEHTNKRSDYLHSFQPKERQTDEKSVEYCREKCEEIDSKLFEIY